ncbi:MAG: redoxin family protein [Planctomycetaceae bacterium]
MTPTTYNLITAVLGIGVLLALVVMIVSLIAMIVRWKTPQRRGHVVRLVISLVAIPLLIGIQQAVLWFVFLPALGQQQMAKVNASRAQKLAETTLLNLGDAVPEMSLTSVDGENITLPMPGKVVLVNFFATWCGPCQVELPHLERIWSDLREDDRFRLVVIGREETEESVRTFREEYGFSFPMAADPASEIYSRFAKESIPRTVVISSAGKIVYSKAGFYEEDITALEASLKDQLTSTDR